MWPFPRKLNLGQKGERIAARHLRRHGYRILARNVTFGRYELDIIAQEGDTVVFVEVKTRVDGSLAAPEENVTRTKRRHIRRAAHAYMVQRDDPSLYYRFDIVSVLLPPQGEPAIELYRNAFPDEDR